MPRVERQSVRYAARAQPLDWLLIRHDHMSTLSVSIDLSPTAGRPQSAAKRPCGLDSATAQLDAALADDDVITSAGERRCPPLSPWSLELLWLGVGDHTDHNRDADRVGVS